MQRAGDILVVDDDAAILQFIAEALGDEGYAVRVALELSEAQAEIELRSPDLLLLDWHVPGGTVLKLVEYLRSKPLHVPIVIMTADTQAAQNLPSAEISYCLLKPFDLEDLFDCVARYIGHECSDDPAI